MSKTTNLSKGPIASSIIRFTIPLVLTALFQQLYSFVDSAIVGNFVGVNSFAAIGVTQSLYFLVLGLAMGSAMGFCVPLAQRFGANDIDGFSAFFWNGTYLSIVISVVFTAISVFLTRLFLQLMNTPEELYEDAVRYLIIIFSGMLITILYNYMAGVIRSLGDSKRPFYFLIVSSILNIILDLIFIIPLKLGVAGAAYATLISQLLSLLLCIYWLFNKIDVVKKIDENGRKLTTWSMPAVKELCGVGLPMGLMFSVSAIGSIILQSSVNSLGSVAVAGQAAGEKVRQIATLPLENLGVAMSTFVAQNIGAKKVSRVKSGIKSGVIIAILYCAIAWAVLLVVKKPLVILLLGNETQPAIDAALKYISIISIFFITHGMMMISRYSLQGLGKSNVTVFSAVAEIIGRAIGGGVAVVLGSYPIICVTSPFCWALSAAFCWTMLAIFIKKNKSIEI